MSNTKFHATVANLMAEGAKFQGLEQFGSLARLTEGGSRLLVKRQPDGCVTVLHEWEVDLLGGLDCNHLITKVYPIYS